MDKEMRNHLAAAEEAVDEAARHLHDAGTAHAKGDHKKVTEKHGAIARCIRSAQAAFKRIADAGAQADLDNSSAAQTSSGVTSGTSGDGDRSSPLWKGDIQGWLDRARVGSRRLH